MRHEVIRHTVCANAALVAVIEPSPERWFLLEQVQVRLKCDANAAARILVLEVSDAAQLLATYAPRSSVAANSDTVFKFMGNYQAAATLLSSSVLSLATGSAGWFPPGSRISLRSDLLQAGDFFTDLIVTISYE